MNIFMNRFKGIPAICFAPDDGAGSGAPAPDASAADADADTNDAFVADGDEGQQDQPETKKANAAASTDDGSDGDAFSDDAEENQDEGSADEDASDGGDEGDAEAPEKYADFELPDGFEISEDNLGEFSERALAANLSQEDAQGFLTLYADKLQEAVAATTEANTEAWNAQTAGFSTASREAGLMKPEVLAMANVGMKNADPTGELGHLLKTLGINKHQAVIRAFSHYGKETSNDQDVPSQDASGKETASLAVNYENAFKTETKQE